MFDQRAERNILIKARVFRLYCHGSLCQQLLVPDYVARFWPERVYLPEGLCYRRCPHLKLFVRGIFCFFSFASLKLLSFILSIDVRSQHPAEWAPGPPIEQLGIRRVRNKTLSIKVRGIFFSKTVSLIFIVSSL